MLFYRFLSCIQFYELYSVWNLFSICEKKNRKNRHFSFFATLCLCFLQWSLWSVGRWEPVPGSQQPLLHLQQLLPRRNRRLPSDGAGGVDVQLKRPSDRREFLTSSLLISFIKTAFITEQETNTAAHSFHGNIHVKKTNHRLLSVWLSGF